MSETGESIDHELSVEDLLILILEQLKLLNLRHEEATETGLTEKDL